MPTTQTRVGLKAWMNPGLWIILAVLLLTGLYPYLDNKNAAVREVIFTMLLSMVLATNLNIIMGYTGYVSFGHVVFFGFGGYTGLYLMSHGTHRCGWPWPVVDWWLGLLAFLLGKAILRLRGAYFALATIGMNEAVRRFRSELSSHLARPPASRSTFASTKITGARPMRSGWPTGSYWGWH